VIGIRLIVNADDFGYSKGVNYGILEAFLNGIVTSTTMMCNYESSIHAFKLMKEHPELPVGIHFVLTSGRPLSKDVPSLVDEDGRFHSYHNFLNYAKQEDVEKELKAQLEHFLSSGYTPTHIDSHHQIHAEEIVLPIVLKLAKQYRLPVRRYALFQDETIKSTDGFLYQFYGEHLSEESFLSLLDHLDESIDTVEMMTHPAYLDAELLKRSSYALPRVTELEILTHPRIKEALHKRGIQLISYREIV
jgi:predicted glycoside hydrolase/deacetylase ChbG (UPF0249 family)